MLVDAVDDDDGALVGRTHREAPEIDGIVRLARRRSPRPGALGARARHRGDRPRPRGQGARGERARDARRRPHACVATATKPSPRPPTSSPSPRLVLAVPTLLLIVDQGSTWLTVSLWFVLTTTDSLDGWLARRDGTTRSGAFLDPLADKFLVLGGFFAARHQRRLLVGRGRSS